MVGAISAVGGYGAVSYVQRYAPENNKVNHESLSQVKAPSLQQPLTPAVAETPVTPVAKVKEVKQGAAELRVDGAVSGESFAAEASARMRVSTEEEQPSAVEELAEKEAGRKEQLEAEQEAEAKKEAYLEELKKEEQARAERIEALKEAQGEEESKGEETEEEKPGALELDRSSALMRNYQMNNLMQEMVNNRAKGEETESYSAAIEALLETGGAQVRHTKGDEENAAHRQQAAAVNRTPFAAVA